MTNNKEENKSALETIELIANIVEAAEKFLNIQ